MPPIDGDGVQKEMEMNSKDNSVGEDKLEVKVEGKDANNVNNTNVNAAPAPPLDAPSYRWFALSSVLVAVLLASSQSSALIIAFPGLMSALDAGLLAILWVLLAYMICISVLVALFGGLSDIVGRKRLFNYGFAIFTVGTFLCGFAQKVNHGWDLVAFRVLQGFGAAVLFSNSTAILTDAFIPYRQVGIAMGMLMVTVAFGSIIGPLIGGGLHNNWIWIFFLNVPLGAIGTGIGFWKLKERPSNIPKESAMVRLKKFDWLGAFFLFAGMSLFLIALTAQAIPDVLTTVEGALFFAVGIAFLIILVPIELYVTKKPLIQMRIFSQRQFAVSCLGNLLISYTRAIVLFTCLFFFQGPYAFGPFMAGVLTIPFGGGILVSGFFSGKFADKYGAQILQSFSPIIMGVACLGMGFISGTMTLARPEITLFILGCGAGLYNSANTMAGMVAVKGEDRGSASGVTMMIAMGAQVLSLVTLFGILTSSVPFEALLYLFLYGGGGPNMGAVLIALHKCFYVGCACSFAASLFHILMNFVIPPRVPFIKAHAPPPVIPGK